MSESFADELSALLASIEKIAEEYRRLRERYEREPNPEERQKLTDAVNRLNEEISGIKLREQAERTIPLPKSDSV